MIIIFDCVLRFRDAFILPLGTQRFHLPDYMYSIFGIKARRKWEVGGEGGTDKSVVQC
jgi:hypothetical protein